MFKGFSYFLVSDLLPSSGEQIFGSGIVFFCIRRRVLAGIDLVGGRISKVQNFPPQQTSFLDLEIFDRKRFIMGTLP